MNVHIIANPAAGGGRGAALANALQRELDRMSIPATVSLSRRIGDAAQFTRESNAECFVSVGGDGTAHEIVNAMDLDRCCLTILRAGTANVVARELKLKGDPRFIATLIAARSFRQIDLGLINGRRFILGAGAGFDATVVKCVADQTNGARGIRRWIGPTLHCIRTFDHAPVRVTVDGEVVTETTPYAIIGNCRYTAGLVPTTPRARIDDGLIDLCAVRRVSIPSLAWLAACAWNRRFPENPRIVYRQGAVIELEAASDLPVPIHADGEPAGFLPARCTVSPRVLRMVAPN